MSQGRVRFIKLLEQKMPSETENIDPLTAMIMPTHSFAVREEAGSLLMKINDRMGVVAAVGSSATFFMQVRRMLLELEKYEKEGAKKEPMRNEFEMQLYGKVEVGMTREGKAIQWIYTEMEQHKSSPEELESPIRLNRSMLNFELYSQKLIELNFLLASFLVYEIADQSDLLSLIKMVTYFYQRGKCLGDGILPSLILIYHKEKFTDSMEAIQGFIKEQLSEAKCPGIDLNIVELVSDNFQDSLDIQQQRLLMSNGKKITNLMRAKRIESTLVTPKLFMTLVEQYFSNKDEEVNLAELWTKAYIIVADEQVQEAVALYLQKFDQFSMGKHFLSHDFFDEVHQRVKGEVLRQLSEKVLRHSQIKRSSEAEHQLLEIKKAKERIEECREALHIKNGSVIMQWAKELLVNEYGLIEKKLGKDIKSVHSYKQEVQAFTDFCRKKTQQYMTLELSLHFHQFLSGKTFEAVQQLQSNQLLPMQVNIKALEARVDTLSNDNKEMKKKYTREESEYQRRDSEMKQQVLHLETKCNLLQQNAQKLKQEIYEMTEKYENKQQFVAEQYYKQLTILKRENEQLSETDEARSKEMSLLTCELNKQRLLHQQTQEYYQQMVNTHKHNEQQIKGKLEQVNLNCSLEVKELKQSSMKEIEDYQLAKSHIKVQVHDLEKIIKEQETLIHELQDHLQQINCNSTIKIQEAFHKLTEAEIRNKVLEDQEVECELLANKLRKAEQKIRRLSKEKDQLLQLSKQSEKTSLITQQRLQYVEQNLQDEKARSKEVAVRISLAQGETEQMRGTIAKLTQQAKMKITVDEWVQVDDELYRDKLRTAIETVKQLEQDYMHMRAEYSSMRSRKS